MARKRREPAVALEEEEVNVDHQRCAACGGDCAPGTTTFTVVVVRDVPAIVCSQCGEDWIQEEVALKLEDVVEAARKRQAVVEVMTWPQIAA